MTSSKKQRPIEGLRQGELGLQDRELIPIAGHPVRRGEGMRESAQPFAKDRVDLGGVQRVGDPLYAAGRVARADAVVQGLERHLPLRELPFQPLVPIQTEFRGIGEVRTELDEERPEVLVENVEVVVIGHRGRPDDPGVPLPLRIPPLFGPKDTGFLLRLSDEQHALLALERREVLLRDVVLPLALLERHQIDPFRVDEALDGVDELLTHRRHHHRRRDARPQLRLHEPDEPSARLQRGDVRIQIHPVDGLQLEGHVIRQDLSDVFAYHDGGAPGERGPCGHRPEQGLFHWRRVHPACSRGSTDFSNEALPQTGCAARLITHARRSEAGPR